MAGAKEIKSQIKSIKNTRKITKAMEMVAASKMRRAQERMNASRPYAERMRQVVAHIASGHLEYKHPYTIERPVTKRVGYIIVSTDRGLAGGLNVNLFKTALHDMARWREQGVEIDIAVFGSKGVAAFRRYGLVAEKSHLGDAPQLTDLVGLIRVMLDAYDSGRIDRLYIVENEFVNSMTQRPQVSQLIPVVPSEENEVKYHWDYIYEPNAEEILDSLMQCYIESLVYQSVVENVACEMAARMVAMKSASDNAGKLIHELQLIYNKARQAAITQEISEIVAGAAAV